jgi:FlaA1/EpsC-like NDP-sugar epimerase
MPITVTDTRMTRYFMTVSDAVTLITDIVDLEHRNATYILDMGEEVPIVSLLPKDYPTVEIGIRPGEKLREELVYEYEQMEDTALAMIKRVEWHPVPMIKNLSKLINELDEETICLKTLNEIITTTTIL